METVCVGGDCAPAEAGSHDLGARDDGGGGGGEGGWCDGGGGVVEKWGPSIGGNVLRGSGLLVS